MLLCSWRYTNQTEIFSLILAESFIVPCSVKQWNLMVLCWNSYKGRWFLFVWVLIFIEVVNLECCWFFLRLCWVFFFIEINVTIGFWEICCKVLVFEWGGINLVDKKNKKLGLYMGLLPHALFACFCSGCCILYKDMVGEKFSLLISVLQSVLQIFYDKK